MSTHDESSPLFAIGFDVGLMITCKLVGIGEPCSKFGILYYCRRQVEATV